jgi:hypothetical protein
MRWCATSPSVDFLPTRSVEPGESSPAIPEKPKHSQNIVSGNDLMADLRETDLRLPFEVELGKKPPERRALPRSGTVLSRIEDATYAILREHEKKSA